MGATGIIRARQAGSSDQRVAMDSGDSSKRGPTLVADGLGMLWGEGEASGFGAMKTNSSHGSPLRANGSTQESGAPDGSISEHRIMTKEVTGLTANSFCLQSTKYMLGPV